MMRLKSLPGFLRLLLTTVCWLSIATAAWSGPAEDAQSAYDRGDYSEAISIWSDLAETGDVVAKAKLGYMYFNGKGVSPDWYEGFQLIRYAAEKGNAEAQSWLALIYASGDGAPKDPELAANWMLSAAKQGHQESQHQYGIYLTFGFGVPQDKSEGAKWVEQAARSGLLEARMSMASRYRSSGMGVERNLIRALYWIELALKVASEDEKKRHNLLWEREQIVSLMSKDEIDQAMDAVNQEP